MPDGSVLSLGTRDRIRAMIKADQPIIITIDGPAGTGKSYVARTLAKRLGLDVLDTGAMYRAAAAITLDRGIPLSDPDRIVGTVMDADLHFDWFKDPPAILAWLRPMNQRIRQPDVTAIVSKVAAIGRLRDHMVRKQRIIAAQHPRLVSEGRDQGSIVFPNAFIKFYLDAEPAVRARRRSEQFRAEEGIDLTLQEVLERILERDRLDASRDEGPLVCPEDAIRIDTTHLDREQVVDRLLSEVRARTGEDGSAP